ncbi:MAG: adenylosuccinate lyase, partial [Deltaproteobacteria bacterium]|nr:adenylosuccinate lyase [Deltaproteobacteria bacterium]
MSKIWSEEAKFRQWLRVEIAVCKAWSKYGRIPAEAARTISKRAKIDVERINELEKILKHDVLAFLTALSEDIGKDSRYLHLGLTSSDILDTALALQLRDAATLLIEDLKKLKGVIKKLAFKHKMTPIIGRTHGTHAEPTTLGLIFALWYDDMSRNLDRLNRARDIISVGKISGAVGTFANVSPEVEQYACRLLELKPARISTQIVQRDIHADYFLTLSIVATSIEKIATRIRHFQKTEVQELEEPFTEGQKGSSAMPHKRNPILSENLCGLARLVRSYALSSLENIPLWHERDISHSSVERVIGPDATILVDFMLNRLTYVLDSIKIYPQNIKRNMELTRGLIYSQKVLLKLVDKGLSREKAYEIIQKNAIKTWNDRLHFSEILLKDKDVKNYLSKEE